MLRARGKLPVVLAVLSALAGCVPGNERPDPPGNAASGVDADERKLLVESDRAVAEIVSKGLLLKNPAVEDYVRTVAARVLPPQPGAKPLTFHVLRDPTVNAFAFPNGHIYVTLGLLARMQNEAQLAFVLGHEAAHVMERHSLESLQDRRSKVVAAHIADLMLLGTSIAYIPFAASIASYSREMESEADAQGLRLAAAAGYSVPAALDIFQVMEEVKSAEAVSGSIYQDHPGNQRRADDLRARVSRGEIVGRGDAGSGADRYAQVKSGIVHENLELKLRVGQYELALDAANLALRDSADDPWLYYYRGEAQRSMGADPKGAAREHAWLYGKRMSDDLVKTFEARRESVFTAARGDFERALTLDADFLQAYRGLGLIAHARGDNAGARASLEKYLSMGEGVRDARYIRSLLREGGDNAK